jgi:putative transposase
VSTRQDRSGKYRGGSLRVPGYDYTQPGAYAVTIKTRGGQALFGQVVDGAMHLNNHGQIVQTCCEEIPSHFPHASVDPCVVMPNHLHAVIILSERPRQSGRQAHASGEQFGRPVRGSLPTIVGSLKSAVSKQVNGLRGTPGGSIWQRGYYDQGAWTLLSCSAKILRR